MSSHFNVFFCSVLCLKADFMGDMCKPEEAAFQKVIDDIGVSATNCVMFEDSIKNVSMMRGLVCWL